MLSFPPDHSGVVKPAKARIQLSNDSCNLAQGDDGRKHGQGLFLTQQNKNWFDMDFGYCKSIGKNRLHQRNIYDPNTCVHMAYKNLHMHKSNAQGIFVQLWRTSPIAHFMCSVWLMI